jgi:hypothetical protein
MKNYLVSTSVIRFSDSMGALLSAFLLIGIPMFSTAAAVLSVGSLVQI